MIPFKDKLIVAGLLNDITKERNKLRDENERLRSQYPRVFKLMDNGKYFVVVAFDEPYFLKVYSMIRDQEKKIGRWNQEDEESYRICIERKHSEYKKI